MAATKASNRNILHRFAARSIHAVASRSYSISKAIYQFGLPDPTVTRPVIVTTVGKVGSSSIAATLQEALHGRPVAHVHWLAANNLRADEEYYKSRARAYRGRSEMANFMPRYVWHGQHLGAAIESAPPGVIWDVVTLVRDPLRRNVSSFFQNLELMYDFWPEKELRSKNARVIAERLVEMFLNSYVANRSPVEHDGDPLTWFDREIAPVFGCDLYATPFPFSSGYEIYTSKNARILLLRLEDVERVASAALTKFFGTDIRESVVRNEATDKAYADIYAWFNKLLVLPHAYVEKIYTSRYCTHFYCHSELDRFRSRWRLASG